MHTSIRLPLPQMWERPTLAGAIRAIEQINSGLDLGEVNAYHLWNLALKAQRAGDSLHWARGLLLDSFADGSRIAAKDDALDLTDGCLTLWGTAAAAPGTDYGTGRLSMTTTYSTPTYTIQRSMTITGFTFRLYGNGSSTVSTKVTLSLNNSTADTVNLTRSLNSGSNSITVSFDPQTLSPGDTVRVSIAKATAGSPTLYVDEDSHVCGYFTISSSFADQGSLTGLSHTMDSVPTRAMAWVRHSGGTVELALNGQSMEETARRQTFSHTGTACIETAFYMEGALNATITPSLTISRGTQASVQLFDYGILLV